MNLPTASVVVVSRDRPDALRRCLFGLDQLQYPDFEIVVVSDAAGAKMLQNHPAKAHIKHAICDAPNISKARNIGIALAAGDVVAFIDDDAVPEPTWLEHLVGPLGEHAVCGGPVRGRNGISWQWRSQCVNALGETIAYNPETDLPEGYALKTEGTNMAVRREALMAIGGFDEAYCFYLDETDVNLRLQQSGFAAGFAQDAEVHHGFMPSAFRRADRVPKDLFEIGASWGVFLRKHALGDQHKPRLAAIRSAEFARLDHHLVQGGLEPRDIRRLKTRLEDGFSEGQERRVSQHPEFGPPPEFKPFPGRDRQSTVLSCRPATIARTREQAQDRVKDGEIVTVINLSPTALYHHVSFTADGVWEQHGGLFGKSERSQRIFRFWRRPDRVAFEVKRVAKQRQIDV